MSHYEITYTGTKADKDKKAVSDCKEYLGTRRFNELCKALRHARNDYTSLRAFVTDVRIQLSVFAGISGYPVIPLIRYALVNSKQVKRVQP